MSIEGDSDYREDEFEREGKKCGIIFLIDARLSMFTKDFTDNDDIQQTRFNIVLKCCRTVLMNKIIAKQKDLLGIVLFGTDKPDPKTNTKHVSLLLDLNYPSAEAVKQLDKLLSDEVCVEVQRTYGSSDDFKLADALWYCSSLFSQCGAKCDDKRILLFTDDSDPHADYADLAHMARKRAKDISQINISLELIAMGNNFDYSKFYKELVEIINDSPQSEELDSSSSLEGLLERVNRIDFKTRRYSKIKWDLGNGVALGVSLYTLFRPANVLPQEPLYRATNESVKRVKQTFDKATGELLLPTDIEEFVTIAEQDIVFSSEEKEILRKIAEPGLTLLGFKPASAVSVAIHCGQPAFAYPEETLVKGSTELMKGLVERCLAKQKVALCCLTPRHRALTKYVYLVPSEETYDATGRQLTPCGFHIIPLPFYNETREQTFEKSPDVDRATIDVAKQIVSKLKFTYKPSGFKNPKLQLFWAHLEALALEYDGPETVEDETIPDEEEQTRRLGSLATKFNNACSLDEFESNKRPSTSKQTSSPAKKAKLSVPRRDFAKEIKAAIAKKMVDKFTVAQLKDFLAMHNQDAKSMRKPALVEAVYGLKL